MNVQSIFSARNMAFFGAIIIIIALSFISPDPYWKILAFIPDGILRTFQVTVSSIILALFIGLITGLGRISRNTFINKIAAIYVEVIRGIPLLVQLFYIYYVLGSLFHLLRRGKLMMEYKSNKA